MNTKITLAYLLSLVLSTFFFSCQSDCECSDTPPYITDLIFTNIKTTSVDNSGDRLNFEEEATTIPYKAIGLCVALTDTVKREIVANVDDPTSTSQVHCTNWYGAKTFVMCDYFYPCYVLKNKISALRIVTLYDFSPEYPAGTEISNLFKVSLHQFSFEEFLYHELDSAIQFYNRQKYYFQTATNFDLVLAHPALCDSMLLEISVEFDDNSALTDTTKTIYPTK